VVIGVLGKFPGAQQFVILQCLPMILNRVERGVENNAVRVEVRIESARRVMCEQGDSKVAGQTVALHATNSNSRCRERWKSNKLLDSVQTPKCLNYCQHL
jgi:hypothetical protein